MLERRSSARQKLESPLAQYIWFYVLFYNVSIVIGSDEMIGKECSFVYFSMRLLEISQAYLRNPGENGRELAALYRTGVILVSERSTLS